MVADGRTSIGSINRSAFGGPLESGRKVADVAADLGISYQTLRIEGRSFRCGSCALLSVGATVVRPLCPHNALRTKRTSKASDRPANYRPGTGEVRRPARSIMTLPWMTRWNRPHLLPARWRCSAGTPALRLATRASPRDSSNAGALGSSWPAGSLSPRSDSNRRPAHYE